MDTLRRAIEGLAVGVAVTVVVLAVAILPFLNPVWVAFEQGRAQATAWTGYSTEELRVATDAILADLVLGPPDFDVTIEGQAVLNERERGHMRDVRSVFGALYIAAAAAAIVLIGAYAASRTRPARFWGLMGRAGTAIAAGTVVLGGLALAFFDVAFELFHTLFFPAGSYRFDPGTERLVQLFPQQFWVESSTAVGIVVVAAGLGLAVIGRRRARLAEASDGRLRGPAPLSPAAPGTGRAR